MFDKNNISSSEQYQFKPVKDIPVGTQIGSLSFGSLDATANQWLSIILTAIVSGTVAGIVWLISSWYVYIFFIQLVIPFYIMHYSLRFAIKKWHFRKTSSLYKIGILASIIAIAIFWGGSFLKFQLDARQSILDSIPDATNAEISEIYNQFLRDETGMGGILGFIHLKAQDGLSISLKMRGIQATGELFRTNVFFTYVYWILEIAILLLLSGAIMTDSKKVYCLDSGTWLESSTIGHVLRENVQSFLESLSANDFQTAGEYVQDDYASTWVSSSQCNNKSEYAILHVYLTEGGKTLDLVEPLIVPSNLIPYLKPILDEE